MGRSLSRSGRTPVKDVNPPVTVTGKAPAVTALAKTSRKALGMMSLMRFTGRRAWILRSVAQAAPLRIQALEQLADTFFVSSPFLLLMLGHIVADLECVISNDASPRSTTARVTAWSIDATCDSRMTQRVPSFEGA